MLERGAHYRSRAALETDHPDVDRAAGIPIEKFERLRTSFTFPKLEQERCQLFVAGSRCNQPHFNGWLAQLKDGTKGLIGKDCVDNHFKASFEYRSERRRVERDLRIDRFIKRINARRSDPQHRARLEAAESRQRSLMRQVERLADLWPRALATRLTDMVKTGNRTVPIRLEYMEKDEKGRPNSRCIDATWGAIVAPESLDPAPARAIKPKLTAAATAFEDARPLVTESESNLRRWADSLEGLDRAQEELEQLVSDVEAFLELDNLKRLPWLVSHLRDQDAIVRTVIELSSGTKASDLAVQRAKKAWADEVRQSNSGRNFRPGN